jgi:hypothetical protein
VPLRLRLEVVSTPLAEREDRVAHAADRLSRALGQAGLPISWSQVAKEELIRTVAIVYADTDLYTVAVRLRS